MKKKLITNKLVLDVDKITSVCVKEGSTDYITVAPHVVIRSDDTYTDYEGAEALTALIKLEVCGYLSVPAYKDLANELSKQQKLYDEKLAERRKQIETAIPKTAR